MVVASKYNIYCKISEEEDLYILMHGYTGALDIVEGRIVRSLKSCENGVEEFSIDEKNKLMQRGYLTTKSLDEEMSVLKFISEKMHSIRQTGYSITIIPTYNCNFRCPYCFEQNNFSNKDMLNTVMSKEMVDVIFDRLEKLREEGKQVEKYISLFGGEPLLKQNIDVIKYIVDKGNSLGYTFGAVTNGYCIDDYIELLDMVKIRNLQITVDGIKEYHDKRRVLIGGLPTFDKIVDNIGLALEKNINVVIRTNVDEDNVEQIKLLLDLFEKKGFNGWTNFKHYFKAVHSCSAVKNDYFDSSIYKKLKEYKLDNVAIEYSSSYDKLYMSIKSLIVKGKMALLSSEYCGSSSGILSIDPFGDIYTCLQVVGDKNQVVGTIGSEKIQFNENYAYWTNRLVSEIDKCKYCPYALYCGGGCPAVAKTNTGSIYSNNCEDFKSIFNEVLINLYNDVIKGQF